MDFQFLVRFGLLLIRPGMVVALTPGLGGEHIPTRVKIGLTVMLAIGLMPSVIIAQPSEHVTLVLVIAREMAVGVSLAFAVRVLIAGAEFAGHLSGYQLGFSYGATVDPQSGVRNTTVAMLYGSLATLGFLAINGHHTMIRALAASYTGIPMGAGRVDASLVDAVRHMFGLVFVVGLRLAAPVIVALLIVELAIGLISRASPSLSSSVIGYPLRILVGLILIGVLVPSIPAVTTSMLDTVLMIGANMARSFR